MTRLKPPDCEVRVYPGMSALPLFNPDLESSAPGEVSRLREAVGWSDALLIASPEYAHGVSGVLKNALDWLVSFEGAVGKPVALVNTSPRAHHARDSLAEILHTMSMDVVDSASVSVPLLGYCHSEEEILRSSEARGAIERLLLALASHLRRGE